MSTEEQKVSVQGGEKNLTKLISSEITVEKSQKFDETVDQEENENIDKSAPDQQTEEPEEET